MPDLIPVYVDPDSGQRISTHSMLKTFRRCPKQAEYKYVLRLKPKRISKPLWRGTWVHRLLQVKYEGGNWRDEHAKLSAKFNEMFDEEKDEYGDLPLEILAVMLAYEWYYGEDDWLKVHQVEYLIETELPDGSIYRCKVDLLVEDQFGLWIVDHKTHARLPDLTDRIIDSQSGDYVWAALKAGIPVQGFVWNYVRWKAPGIPQMAYAGTKRQRLSLKEVETDWPTFRQAIREYQRDWGLEITDSIRARAKQLKATRYRHGEPQRSPFFLRAVLERDSTMLSRVAKEMYHTHRRMHEYPWEQPGMVERVPDRGCKFACSYSQLCAAELWGGESAQLRRQFKVGDPLDYYNDEKELER